MKISIRKPTKKEIPIILGLLYELGRPRAKQSSDANIYENLIKKYLEDSDKQILVAILEAKIVGIVSIVYIQRLNQKSLEMYIPELLVTKNFQNQGIGKKLVHSCIELAIKKKCHRIRLESGNQRKESHIFYKNLEFSQSSLSFSKNLE